MVASDLDLVLDVEIRNNVLLSILVTMFCLSLIRTYFFHALFGPSPPTLEKVYDDQICQRVRRLQQNGNRITKGAFLARREFYNHPKEGLLTKKAKKPKPIEGVPEGLGNNPLLSDPSNMGGMMKSQFAMIFNNVYMIVLYGAIENFFSGFIAAKLPFSLTRGFKMMFQAGIDLNDLEVSYISSSSWYLLNFTGMNGVNEVLLGPKADINVSQMSMPIMQTQQGAVDPVKLFSNHKESLAIRDHKWDAKDCLKRLVGMKIVKPTTPVLPPKQTTGKPNKPKKATDKKNL